LNFSFPPQATVAPCNFSRENLSFSISATAGVTNSSVYDLASALISRGVGRMPPRSSTTLDRAHHRRSFDELRQRVAKTVEITGDEQWL
jgi:hypothetical protein